MKLVFDYTMCSEPECWEFDIPFEYESKEKFIFDVLDNPLLLSKIGLPVHQYMIDNNEINKQKYFKNLDQYVFTLEEWFNKNKRKV